MKWKNGHSGVTRYIQSLALAVSAVSELIGDGRVQKVRLVEVVMAVVIRPQAPLESLPRMAAKYEAQRR